MASLEKAIEIAARAHAGVPDKNGQPYILHPLRVMLGVEGNMARIVAVLHDVVEDTDLTFEDIAAEGFSPDVMDALKLVTHQSGQSYADYVIACQANAAARQVKLSDLRDNASLSRILLRPDRLPKDSARVMRYLLSYKFLTGEIPADEYRELMAPYEK
jgi:(p)ppGpp synthase/HD superfamily hydrolase